MAMSLTEWNKELERLEDFYQVWELPIEKVPLNGIIVNNTKDFVNACFRNLRGMEPNVWLEGNFHRLRALESYLRENENGRP